MKADIKTMTPAERAELFADLQKEQKQAVDLRAKEIETYKSMVDKTIMECFPRLLGVSTILGEEKGYVREQFRAIIDLKRDLYKTKDDQNSHTFTTEDGTHRIRIGYNVVDDYDDTVNEGIEKVRNYIASLAKDAETELLVNTVMELLSRDKKGTLKASRVLQLQQMAEKTGDPAFLEGVKIIRDAYRPQYSKSYIRAEHKDGLGAWVAVPLGMTEAE